MFDEEGRAKDALSARMSSRGVGGQVPWGSFACSVREIGESGKDERGFGVSTKVGFIALRRAVEKGFPHGSRLKTIYKSIHGTTLTHPPTPYFNLPFPLLAYR